MHSLTSIFCSIFLIEVFLFLFYPPITPDLIALMCKPTWSWHSQVQFKEKPCVCIIKRIAAYMWIKVVSVVCCLERQWHSATRGGRAETHDHRRTTTISTTDRPRSGRPVSWRFLSRPHGGLCSVHMADSSITLRWLLAPAAGSTRSAWILMTKGHGLRLHITVTQVRTVSWWWSRRIQKMRICCWNISSTIYHPQKLLCNPAQRRSVQL